MRWEGIGTRPLPASAGRAGAPNLTPLMKPTLSPRVLRGASAAVFACLVAACADDTHPTAPPYLPQPAVADLVPGPVPAFCGPATTVDLLAGQHEKAGLVTVGNTDEHVYVTYTADPGWSLGKTALFVGDAVEQIPLSGGGNPQIGRFPYKASHPDATMEAIWRVPLSAVNGASALIAAFAEVPERGAWGEGTQINSQAGWAMYLLYPIAECDGNGGGEGGVEETIGTGGGTVDLDERVELEILAGALDEDTDITIDPAPDVAGTIPGTVFDFGPDGTEFNVPALLRICYDPADLPGGVDEALLRLVRILPGDPEETDNSGVDEVGHCVFGEVDHFSEFAAAEILPPPPPPDPDYHVVVLGQGEDLIPGALVTLNPVTNAIVGITHQNLDSPFAIARIPGSDGAWIGNRGDGTLVECAWSSTFPWLPGCGLAPVGGFGDPVGIALAFDPLVADQENSQVIRFSNPGSPLAVSAPPTAIAGLPDGSKAYVGAGGFVDVIGTAGALSLLSTVSLELPATDPVAAHAVAVAPDGNYVYVLANVLGEEPLPGDPQDLGSGRLYRISTATDEIDGAVHTSHNSLPLAAVTAIVVNAAGTTAYVSGGGPLYVVDLASWTISAALEIDGFWEAQFMALSPDESTLWATHRFGAHVMRVDIATETGTTINIGFGPGGGVLVIP
jgi:hypothetical protein